MEFKKLTFRDLAFVYVVRKQSAEYLHDPTIFSYEEVISWFNANKLSPNWYWWMIYIEGGPIGYIRGKVDENNRFFIGMDLHEKFRGKGYSQWAYREFIASADKYIPYNELWLKVLKTNTRAIHIYQKLGFTEVETELIDRAGLKVESITYKLTLRK